MPLLFYFKTMKIHSSVFRGYEHKHFCQDALAMRETEHFLFAAIFDGCSGGKDSHFAANLFAKIFNDCLSYPLMFNAVEKTPKDNAQTLVYMIGRKIVEVKNLLHLEIAELLSTMVLCVVNKNTKECCICAFGDGFFSVNGAGTVIKNTKFTDENMPDYIAYNLAAFTDIYSFTKWFSENSTCYEFSNASDITISSDGINTFTNYKDTTEIVDPINYLVQDEALINTLNMFERKLNLLYTKKYMVHKDDLSIVRIKFD
jgi:hypothetical protein